MDKWVFKVAVNGEDPDVMCNWFTLKPIKFKEVEEAYSLWVVAWQSIHMKYQDSFNLKKKCCLLQL